MVLNTHFPGLMGPCRAVPVTTAVQPSSSCIPTVAVVREKMTMSVIQKN